MKTTFQDFWILYDKKIGKVSTEKLWKKLNTKDKEELMEYIPLYKKARPDKLFRKDPIRFLRHRVWEDEIIMEEKEYKWWSPGKRFYSLNGEDHEKAMDKANRAGRRVKQDGATGAFFTI